MNHLKAWFATLLLAATLAAQEAPRKFDAVPKEKESTSVARKPHKGFDDANARAQWMRERMGGDPPPGFSQRVFREALKVRGAFPQRFQRPDFRMNVRESSLAAAVLPSWVPLGPTNADFSQNGVTLNKIDSGRLRNILPHPTDPNTVFVLTSGGGLWKTADFGAIYPTWVPLTDFVGSTSGGAAAFGRTPDILYLGLGDPFDGSQVGSAWSVGGALVRSGDSGQTWSTPVAFSNLSGSVNDIGVDTSQALDTVLVGTDKGLFRSADGGQTLAQVPSIPATHIVWSLVRTSTVWLAATREMDSSSPNFQFGFLYQSNDRGATWTPTADLLMASDPFGRFTLAVAQPGDATVYAYAADKTGSATFDLYVSLNGGASWTKKNLVPKVPANPNADQPNMDLMHDQAWYNHMILVAPTDATRNTVYLGGNLSSAKSTDGGATWQLVSNWLPRSGISLPYVHADFMCAAFQTAGGVNRVLVGNDGGIFVSSDSGQTWDDRKNRGLNSTLIYSLAVNPNVPGSALIGLQDNGTRIRQGTTGTFNAIYGGDGMGTGWAQGSGVSLGSYVYNQIYRSTTNPPTDQANFSDFVTGLGTVDGTNYYFVTPIYTPPFSADPSGQVFFTYGNAGTGPNSKSIFRSSATGWSKIGAAGVTPGFSSTTAVRSVSHGLGVSPQDLNRIAAAANSGTVLITSNGGSNWTEVGIASQVSGWGLNNANVVWFNNNILYTCSEGTQAGVVRVARSSTGGTTWNGAGTGLPDVPVTRLAVDPTDATGNSVYAGTWIGVYKTTDGGVSWTPYGQGLPQVRITDIFVAPDGSFIRVGTYGRGVWEIAGAAAPGPAITTHPANQTVTVGQTATFTVVASGTMPLTYQWKKGITNVGTNSNSYTTPATILADSGSQFTVVVTNTTGSTTSSIATLTVNPKSRDVNGDGPINVLDITALMAAYSGSNVLTSNPAADLDGDGDCDDADLALLLAGI